MIRYTKRDSRYIIQHYVQHRPSVCDKNAKKFWTRSMEALTILWVFIGKRQNHCHKLEMKTGKVIRSFTIFS